MITIRLYTTLLRRVQVTVCEDATPGSWGSHQLLLSEYRKEDDQSSWQQMLFNYDWLKDKQLDYGPLWCVYCGKEELVIYHWRDKPNFSDMATADHFLPKSLYPHLARDKKNLRVACHRCNNRKGQKLWKEEFPYD